MLFHHQSHPDTLIATRSTNNKMSHISWLELGPHYISNICKRNEKCGKLTSDFFFGGAQPCPCQVAWQNIAPKLDTAFHCVGCLCVPTPSQSPRTLSRCGRLPSKTFHKGPTSMSSCPLETSFTFQSAKVGLSFATLAC